MKRRLNVGLIGHMFMGKIHSYALKNLETLYDLNVVPVMKTICGIEDDVAEFAKQFGWESYEHSWEKVVNDPEIDIINISSPGFTHVEIALAAAERGKHIFCEKPLANTLSEAEQMLAAVNKNGVKHMVDFNCRRIPAVNLAKKLVDEGSLGRIYHFNAIYQQDWPISEDFPYVWRFDKKLAGAGSMADKGSHIIDLARFLIGEFDEVACTTEIFLKERKDGDSFKEVTTDDAAVFISRFKNGVLGLFETSRMSAGHRNNLQFEINGSRGSVKFDIMRLNELEVYFANERDDAQGFRTVLTTQPSHKYAEFYWPTGHILGWERQFCNQHYEFFKAIENDTKASPGFDDGVEAQRVIEAAEIASAEKRWVKI